MGRDWLDPDSGYSFLAMAAAEARRASDKYWATSHHPVHYLPPWSDPPRSPKAEVERKRRRRREGIDE